MQGSQNVCPQGSTSRLWPPVELPGLHLAKKGVKPRLHTVLEAGRDNMMQCCNAIRVMQRTAGEGRHVLFRDIITNLLPRRQMLHDAFTCPPIAETRVKDRVRVWANHCPLLDAARSTHPLCDSPSGGSSGVRSCIPEPGLILGLGLGLTTAHCCRTRCATAPAAAAAACAAAFQNQG